MYIFCTVCRDRFLLLPMCSIHPMAFMLMIIFFTPFSIMPTLSASSTRVRRGFSASSLVAQWIVDFRVQNPAFAPCLLSKTRFHKCNLGCIRHSSSKLDSALICTRFPDPPGPVFLYLQSYPFSGEYPIWESAFLM